ncbi:hypothetical protein MPL3356_340188 [Mesorhizobium plurifarium]|uniref:Uncharacterized protein n=1 Tax=Mesorhizobium plurifarium TaxID=69974 RepID=A0A090DVP7_MESPL|nr:hypothetical protein MPL3356_340188 [Mesorhizobium plurifarium]
MFSSEWKDALWDRFYTVAPRRQRQSVEQYKIVMSGWRPLIKGLFSVMGWSRGAVMSPACCCGAWPLALMVSADPLA